MGLVLLAFRDLLFIFIGLYILAVGGKDHVVVPISPLAQVPVLAQISRIAPFSKELEQIRTVSSNGAKECWSPLRGVEDEHL